MTGGIEVHEKIVVKVSKQMFEAESRDYSSEQVQLFYQNEKFTKEYKIDGEDIVTIRKI